MAEQSTDQASPLAEGMSPLNVAGLFDAAIGLAFIVLLSVALALLFRKFGYTGVGVGGLIKVVAAMSLGGRDRIALISVGQKQMLLGISPGRIATLHVFEEPFEDIVSTGSAGQSKNPSSEFAKKLQGLLPVNRS